MSNEPLVRALAPWVILSPAAAFALLSVLWFLDLAPSERLITRITASALLGSLAASLLTAWSVFTGTDSALRLTLGDWFAVSGYAFPLGLHIDRLAAAMMVLTSVICGLIGRFSATYLHREPGFLRFFLLLLLFAAAMLLLVMAGSIDLLFAGWELVGLSSILLIAFFHERPGAVRGSLRALITYRACDIGLLFGAVLLHHYARSSEFSVMFDAMPAAPAPPAASVTTTIIALSFVVAAMGKSAQAPLTGWLPRAMEGPTPSSALFYGALSVHAGAYLLLRMQPLLARSPIASAATVLIGAVTAISAALTARVQVDVKSALAYGTASQVGLIFVEIGLGLRTLAALHLCGHACVRAFQLLRAPAALHELRRAQAARGGEQPRIGAIYERLLPADLRDAIYRLALLRFHADSILDHVVAKPVLALAQRLAKRQTALAAVLTSRRSTETSEVADPTPAAEDGALS